MSKRPGFVRDMERSVAENLSYVDGIGRVTVVNGLVHIDLVAAMPPAQEGGQTQIQVTQRLVMGLPQFVRLCSEMSGHLQRMEGLGLIKRQPSSDAN